MKKIQINNNKQKKLEELNKELYNSHPISRRDFLTSIAGGIAGVVIGYFIGSTQTKERVVTETKILHQTHTETKTVMPIRISNERFSKQKAKPGESVELYASTDEDNISALAEILDPNDKINYIPLSNKKGELEGHLVPKILGRYSWKKTYAFDSSGRSGISSPTDVFLDVVINPEDAPKANLKGVIKRRPSEYPYAIRVRLITEIESVYPLEKVIGEIRFPDGIEQNVMFREISKENETFKYESEFDVNLTGDYDLRIIATNVYNQKSTTPGNFYVGVPTQEKLKLQNPSLLDEYFHTILSDSLPEVRRLSAEDVEKILQIDLPILINFSKPNPYAMKFLYREATFHLLSDKKNHVEVHGPDSLLATMKLIQKAPNLIDDEILIEGYDIYPNLIDLVDPEKVENDPYYFGVLYGIAWFGSYWFYSVNKIVDSYTEKPFGPMVDYKLDDVEKEILRERFKQMVEGPNLIPTDLSESKIKWITIQATLPYSLLWQNIDNPNDQLLPYLKEGYLTIKNTDYTLPFDTRIARDMLYKNVVERIPNKKKEIQNILNDPSYVRNELENLKKYFLRYTDWPKLRSEFSKVVEFIFEEGTLADRAWLVIDGISCKEIQKFPDIEPREKHFINLRACVNSPGFTFLIKYPEKSTMAGKFHSTAGASISGHLRGRMFKRYGNILVHEPTNAICPWFIEDFLEGEKWLTIQYAFGVDSLL